LLSCNCASSDPGSRGERTSSASHDLAAAEVCPTDRVVWYSPVGPGFGVPADLCLGAIRRDRSPAGTWTGRRLFAGAPLDSELARYCLYTFAPSDGVSPAPADPDEIRDAMFVHTNLNAQPERDCPIVAPVGWPYDGDAAFIAMRDKFREMAGRASKLPAKLGDVRVAVLDTAARAFASNEQDRFAHGRVVGTIALDLSCPEGIDGPACRVGVANHLATPRISATKVDRVDGGYYGTATELAQALFAAVGAWRSDTAQGNLVVNLSLGWHESFGGPYGTVRDLPAPVRAVQAMITDASCRGAVLIAAAGNAGLGTGPLYPAGWEAKPAPTMDECRVHQGSGAQWRGDAPSFRSSTYRPLVYAVGGVDAADNPLANGRPGARPRLAGYGHAVTTNDSRTPFTPPMSGTSVSTAVVSGIVAAAWGYRPLLGAHQIMEVVYRSAVPLGATADFCLGGRCGSHEVRRVSLCAAVPSPIAGTCATVPARAGHGLGVEKAWYEADPDFRLAGSAESTPAHTDLETSPSPWVFPQPGSVGCGGACGFSTTGELIVSILPDFTYDFITITAGRGTWSVTPPATSPRSFRVVLSGFPPPGTTSASINFYRRSTSRMAWEVVSEPLLLAY
jgi:hypothetical protein